MLAPWQHDGTHLPLPPCLSSEPSMLVGTIDLWDATHFTFLPPFFPSFKENIIRYGRLQIGLIEPQFFLFVSIPSPSFFPFFFICRPEAYKIPDLAILLLFFIFGPLLSVDPREPLTFALGAFSYTLYLIGVPKWKRFWLGLFFRTVFLHSPNSCPPCCGDFCLCLVL